MTDTTGQMEGHGFYDQHSLAQRSAGALGLPLLQRAVEAVATLDDVGGAAPDDARVARKH